MTTPLDALNDATQVAEVFSRIVAERRLATRIGGTDYIRVEGWTLLAQMMGRTVGTAQTEVIVIDEVPGFRSRATVYGPDGVIEGHADGLCMRSERQWAHADEHALAGMAQTRAISRALRERFGFIVVLAGYVATPAEEIGIAPMFDDSPVITPDQVKALVDLAAHLHIDPDMARGIVQDAAGVASARQIPRERLDAVRRAFARASTRRITSDDG